MGFLGQRESGIDLCCLFKDLLADFDFEFQQLITHYCADKIKFFEDASWDDGKDILDVFKELT